MEPDLYDLSHTTQRIDTMTGRLELLAVQLARVEEVLKAPLQMVQVRQGRKVKLPITFVEVAGEPDVQPETHRNAPLMTTDEIDALMGW